MLNYTVHGHRNNLNSRKIKHFRTHAYCNEDMLCFLSVRPMFYTFRLIKVKKTIYKYDSNRKPLEFLCGWQTQMCNSIFSHSDQGFRHFHKQIVFSLT